MIQRRTVGIVGAGHVGVAAALAIFARHIASEIVLVDSDPKRAEGEAMDLAHAQSLVGRARVRAGSWSDLGEAQVIVLAAGTAQKPGETRLDLLGRNAAIFREIARELDRVAPESVLVVATNPVDVLTYALQELSSRPHERVLGTGTMLDTARFRAALGAKYGVSPRSVHAYILGEHGDSEVPIWSNATIGGVPLRAYATFDEDAMHALFVGVRDAAYGIIERKGYTSSAIGIVIAALVEAILSDERSILPVSTRLDGEYGLRDACLSLPCVIGAGGLEQKILPSLDENELALLRQSNEVLASTLRALGPMRARP